MHINITIGRTPASWSDTSDKFDYLDLLTNIVYRVSTASFDHLQGQIRMLTEYQSSANASWLANAVTAWSHQIIRFMAVIV